MRPIQGEGSVWGHREVKRGGLEDAVSVVSQFVPEIEGGQGYGEERGMRG